MDTTAVVIEAPEQLSLRDVALEGPADDEVVVDIAWSGISTGTERLLWSGRMPPFPGLGYPLVPGYESVGRVVDAGRCAADLVGRDVFVPGATCYGAIRGLFGGAARRLVSKATKVAPLSSGLDERATLLALAATAHHALAMTDTQGHVLIVGHGVLGRLLARLCLARGAPPPVVWERLPERRGGATGYTVIDPEEDERSNYACIIDVSGDAGLLDALIARLAPRGEVVLAGFYATPVKFDFPPAFIKEARLRVAAEWTRTDLDAVTALVASDALSLDALITHRAYAADAADAYPTAFEDPRCLKMILDWRNCS